jgi:hypothetical protein
VVDDKGATLYEHLQHLRKAHGITDPRLVMEPLPASAEWLHRQFWRLSRRRSFTQHGAPLPITYAEISALQSVNSIPFTQFDLDALDQMDTAYVGALNKTKGGG